MVRRLFLILCLALVTHGCAAAAVGYLYIRCGTNMDLRQCR